MSTQIKDANVGSNIEQHSQAETLSNDSSATSLSISVIASQEVLNEANLSQNGAEDEERKSNLEKMVDDKNNDSLTGDELALSLSASGQMSQFEVDDGEKKEKKKLEDQVKWLLGRNKRLTKNLKHSRKRCREMIEELRAERQKNKKIRSDDFVNIQKILSKYI